MNTQINLAQLQENVQRMIDGETKRREVAIRFLESAESIIHQVAEHIFSRGMDASESTEKVGKSGCYFRWEAWQGQNAREEWGFYYRSETPYDGFCVWGDPLKEVHGTAFWGCIRSIVEWIPTLAEKIDQKEKSREKLLALLK